MTTMNIFQIQIIDENEKSKMKKKRGPPPTGKAVTSFECIYCNQKYKCRGPNSFHFRQHYESDKCKFNKMKYFELALHSESERLPSTLQGLKI